MFTRTNYLRPLVLLMLAALAASVMMVALASPAQAANLTVNSPANTDDGACNTEPDCTLREAINAANASRDVADTIDFDQSLSGQTIHLQGFELPPITDPAGLIIDGGNANITISADNLGSVVSVHSGGGLTLNKLTVADANIGAISVANSTLEVSNSTFSSNKSVLPLGGAIYSVGSSVTVSNSTFSDNKAGFAGGAITVDDGTTLKVSNSTFSGNSTGDGVILGQGGAIAVQDSTATITNSTISGNTAAPDLGGGVRNAGNATITLSNTLLANNAGGNCSETITDGGGNLDDGETCGFTAASSKSNTPAGLDPLGLKNNGGPTQTIALQEGSAAIDAAVDCPPPATDQRGVSRPQGSACDIGAFEFQSPPALSINDVSLTEGDSGTTAATFTLSLSKPSSQPVTVNYATADETATAGTDYQSSTGTVVFAPNQTTQTFSVQVIGDNVYEDDETFFVNLGNPSGATISDAQGKGTITNDDPPPDTAAPSVSCSVTPNKLVLPANNHKLVTVNAAVTVEDSGSGPNGFKLVSVTSNQADSGLGPDDVPNDIQGWSIGTADTSGQLRAERYGKDRIYTLTYEGADNAGNKETCSATVTVPKPTNKKG